MKNILVCFLLIAATVVIAQDFDESYLESLPEEIRDDVEDKLDAQQDLEKPVYRRASSQIDKIDDKDKNRQLDKDKKESRIFGKNFFDTIQSSFMPINEPNFDATYILDFGDVLEIQFIGQFDSLKKYEVKRDGSINISEIGKVTVAGLSLGDAADLIKAKVSSTFIGTNAYVSLINIRDISILVAGNSFNPGIYTLNGNSSILHAVSVAGGINDIGSYRNIQLIRNNQIIDNLDIYEVLIEGKSNFSKSLRSGDSIVIKPVGKLVSIESGVNRSGVYEIKEDESLKDLIVFANGVTKDANLNEVFLKRANKDNSAIFKINFDKLDTYSLEDGDSIYITEYKYNEVEILGAVRNPGVYKLPLGTTLSQLIDYAGGYENQAYPFAGYLKNKKTLMINNDSKEKLYDKFLNNLIRNLQSPSGGLSIDSNFQIILKELKNAPSTGRIIAEFDVNVIKRDPNLDTILEDGDEIMIPNLTQQVYVQGEVSNPGAIRYNPNKNINFYIKNAGGSLDSSDLSNIFIVHPNGETKSIKSNSALSFLQSDNKIMIYPGSIIFIPRSTNIAGPIEAASIWAPIISSVALSLTSLSVLNNNN